MGRRFALAVTLGLAASSLACGPRREAVTPVAPIHLPKGEEILTRAGLQWVVRVEPESLLSKKELRDGLLGLFEKDAATALEARHGLDPRKAKALFIAQYSQSMLYLFAGPIDPARVDAAFSRRIPVESSKIVRAGDWPARIVQRTGPGSGSAETIAVVGLEGALLERGDQRHLVAAVRGIMGRPALPALVTPPLADVSRELDGANAPACVFAPGPFSVEAKGLGHLLAVTKGAGACARESGDHLLFQGVVLGDFRADEERIVSLLTARFDELRKSGLGRLALLDATPLVISVNERRVSASFSSPTSAFLKGLRQATAAELQEIVATP